MASVSAPTPGDVLHDRYVLDQAIGEGASSQVFRATDRQTGEQVAVKVLRPELFGDPGVRRRFRREADVLRQLEHPAIVRWVDFDQDAFERLFMVTEWVNGTTLRTTTAHGAMPWSDVRALMITLCDAAHHAHELGIIHGDLKPENILLPQGVPAEVRIVDFGTSKILGLERLTRTDELAGTPQYMAPELLTGRAPIGAKVDVYSLGVIAYECIAGRAPFEESHVGRLLFKIASGDAVPIDRVADVPAEVSNLVMQAMHVHPDERFAHMRELRAAWHELA